MFAMIGVVPAGAEAGLEIGLVLHNPPQALLAGRLPSGFRFAQPSRGGSPLRFDVWAVPSTAKPSTRQMGFVGERWERDIWCLQVTRLAETKESSSAAAANGYDFAGRRVSKTISGPYYNNLFL